MSSLVVRAMPYFADHSVLSDLISVCLEIPGEFSPQTVVNDDVSIQRAILIFGLESLCACSNLKLVAEYGLLNDSFSRIHTVILKSSAFPACQTFMFHSPI
jgi:hypothetical protein